MENIKELKNSKLLTMFLDQHEAQCYSEDYYDKVLYNNLLSEIKRRLELSSLILKNKYYK